MATKKALKAGTAESVGKDTIRVNLKGIEVGKRKARIPEGQYKAKVQSAELTKGKNSGNPMVHWIFEITEGKYEGVGIHDNTVLIENSLWTFRRVLTAIGIKVKDSTMDIPLAKLVGRTLGIEVVDGEPYGDNSTVSSEINDLFPIEQLDDEDDEEESDDEEKDEEDTDDEDEDDEEEIDLDDEEL